MEKQQDSRWFDVRSVAADYSFPVDDRPGQLPITICNTIPVVDLHSATTSKDKLGIVQQIIKAGQEYGLFQVTFAC